MPMTDKLEIVQIPTGQIKEWPRNPKKHNQAAINASVEAFGVRQPIIVVPDGDGYRIVAGHGRIKAFAAAGLSDVPCIVWDETNRELIDAYAIADNQLTMAAGWEDIKLSEVMQDISINLPDLDFGVFGFEDDILRELLGDDIPGEIVEDEAPEPPEEPISKLGDLWTCGRHRVLCGDATKEGDVKRLMGGKKINLVVTSPPYYNQREYSYFDSIEEYKKLLSETIRVFKLFLSKNAIISWNCGNGQADNFDISAMNSMTLGQASLTFCDKIVWRKKGGIFDIPRSQHIENMRYFPAFGWEPIYVYKNGTMPQFDPKYHDIAREYQINVWDIPQVRTNEEAVAGHPAMFPVLLPSLLIMFYSSEKNKNIYDCYTGGGTTLIAAEQLDRTFYGMEITPKYIDVILQRYYNLTNISPVRDDGVKWTSLI